MKLIERPRYLDRLAGLRGTPDIKIITGMRRSGKSKLLEAFSKRIKEESPNSNLIYIDLVDFDNEQLKEAAALHRFIENRHQEGVENLLFIDEVQLCKGFERVVNSLHAKEKYDIYLSGSNAFLLSADLATLFTGRFLEVHVFPFSFAEYCAYHSGQNADIDALFDSYAEEGGLAGSYVYRSERDRKTYIEDVYKTILYRDLAERYNLADRTVLERLSEFLLDNIGNITSPNKVSNTLVSGQVPTSHVTVGNYIKYMCHAYLFYRIKRFDIQGKRYLTSSEKYYLCDTGIRQAVLGTRNKDYGRIYENIVCIELLRRGYEVYIGKLYEKEVDFVAKKGNEQFYVQVSDDISRPETFRREYEPLLKIRDAYPKMIIARTKHEAYSYEGITVADIARWLKEE